ncbi:MAG TPA: trypsin-like peptidase domain-containing protein [Candidatus Polarisedimenticolaceae bacterium]|nr:trypsin-like peptidase domain-containing protein [Candidatus Polarisedimenticolaceae bacterium]
MSNGRKTIPLATATLLLLLAPGQGHATHRIGAVIAIDEPIVIGPATGGVHVFEDADHRPAGADPALFLLLHFRSGPSAGDSVTLDLGNGQSENFDSSSGANFWTRPIRGDTVSVTYIDGNHDGLGSVTLFEYGRGEYAEDTTGDLGELDDQTEGSDPYLIQDPFVEPDFRPQGKCNSDDTTDPTWDNVACLDDAVPEESIMRDTARSVGIIIAAADSDKHGADCHPGEDACLASCTGAWIGNGRILTAGHCFATDADLASASFTVGFATEDPLATCDVGSRPDAYAPQFFRLKRVAATGWFGCPTLDYSVIELDAPAGGIGVDPLPLLDHDVACGTDLFVIHHPRGSSKKVSSQFTAVPDEQCRVIGSGGGVCVDNPTDSTFSLRCDADNGSSGSPVFDASGNLVGVLTGAGCSGASGANSGFFATAAFDELLCAGPPLLDYAAVGVSSDWPAGVPLRAGQRLGPTVEYGLAAGGGPRCGGDCFTHRTFFADPADTDTPLGSVCSWSDSDYLRPGETTTKDLSLPSPCVPVPCPAVNGDMLKLVATLNAGGIPEASLLNNTAVSAEDYQVCFPDLSAELPDPLVGSAFFEALCDGACDGSGSCEAGDPTELCDADGCELDRCVMVQFKVCNTGCAAADRVDLDLSLAAAGRFVFGAIPLCLPLEDSPHRETHFDTRGLGAGTAEDPTCRNYLIPFQIPDFGVAVDGAVTALEFSVRADSAAPVRDCALAGNADTTGSLAVDCEDPECIFDDSCVCLPDPDACDPDEDDDDEGDGCFGFGCFELGDECCTGPEPPAIPCWAYFDLGGTLCGDPRVGELFLFGQEIEDVFQSTDPEGIDEALGIVLQQVEQIPQGANVTPSVMYLAEQELEGLLAAAGSAGGNRGVLQPVARWQLEWTLRLYNASDLDLRTEGLEVPVSVPTGTNVSVSLGGGITLTFDHATAVGTVTPRFRQVGRPVPPGYHAGNPFYTVDLESTVTIAPGSQITVTIDPPSLYFRQGAQLRLFQEEQDTYVDRTTTINPNGTVSGRVTQLSRFILLGTGGVTSIACPPDVSLACPANTSPSVTGTATASGTGGPITISHSDRIATSSGGAGTLRRTWRATDGFSGQLCKQTIVVADTVAPVLSCPPAVTVGCQIGGRAQVTLPPATATDGCDGGATVTNDHTPNGADASGSYPLGATVVTFQAIDGSGNVASCPTTVTVSNGSQDTDQDSVGNVCDNCPFAANSAQADADQDAHGDACDCAPGDPGAWAVPADVTGVAVRRVSPGPDSVEISWGSLASQAGPAVVYDVVTGTLPSLRTSGYSTAACLALDETGTSIVKSQPTSGAWYLVRAENACGLGSWGHGSGTPDPRGVLNAMQCTAPHPVLGITKTAAPSPVGAGGLLTYTLAYSNSGTAAASGVVLVDSVPANTTFVSATGGGSFAAGLVTWNLGSLASGAAGSVDLVVRVGSPLADGTLITNATYGIDGNETNPTTGVPVVTAVGSTPSLSVSKSASPDPVGAGADLSYQLSYANTGSAAATNVVLVDTVPAHSRFVSATGGGALSGAQVVWNLGTLAAGASGSVGLVVRVDSPLPGGSSIANTSYSIDSSETAPSAGPPRVTAVTSAPVLSVSKTATPNPVSAGGQLTYTLSYRNDGNADATGVRLSDELSDLTTFVSASAGGILHEEVVIWEIGTLPPGASGSVQVTVEVEQPLPNGTLIHNDEYAIESNETAAVEGAAVITSVSSAPVLAVLKTDAPDPVAAGADLTYSLSFANTGNANATGVVIRDPLPANTTFVSASGGGTFLTGGIVSWTIGSLAAGANGTVQLVVRVANPWTGGTLANGGYTIDSDQTAPVSGPPVSTTVVNLPIVALDLDVSTPTVIDSVRTFSAPVSSLDVGIIVDARGSTGIGSIARIVFGAINSFNGGGATITSITPLTIADILPPPGNAGFSSLAGEFQFGAALFESGSAPNVFTGGPVQYARFRVFFAPGTLVPGSIVRLYVGDRGPGTGAVRRGGGQDISGDFSADGTPVFGNPGSDQGSGAGVHYRDAELHF